MRISWVLSQDTKLGPIRKILVQWVLDRAWYVYFIKALQVILIFTSGYEALLSENPMMEFLPSHCPREAMGTLLPCSISWGQVTWDSLGIPYISPQHINIFISFSHVKHWYQPVMKQSPKCLSVCLWTSFQMECDDSWDSQTNPIAKRTSWNEYTPIWGNYYPAVFQANIFIAQWNNRQNPERSYCIFYELDENEIIENWGRVNQQLFTKNGDRYCGHNSFSHLLVIIHPLKIGMENIYELTTKCEILF